jgi:hypothetical protein
VAAGPAYQRQIDLEEQGILALGHNQGLMQEIRKVSGRHCAEHTLARRNERREATRRAKNAEETLEGEKRKA